LNQAVLFFSSPILSIFCAHQLLNSWCPCSLFFRFFDINITFSVYLCYSLFLCLFFIQYSKLAIRIFLAFFVRFASIFCENLTCLWGYWGLFIMINSFSSCSHYSSWYDYFQYSDTAAIPPSISSSQPPSPLSF